MKKELKSRIHTMIQKRIEKKALPSEFYEKMGPPHIRALCEEMGFAAFLFLIFITIFPQPNIHALYLYSLAIIILSMMKKGYQSWLRLLQLHKIIASEKWEIEHHRKKEKKELEIIYKAKGFSGQLLEDVITILMSDDNRLLQVMLEEEMGIVLESYEHPLKEAVFAGLGSLITAIALLSTISFISPYIAIGAALFLSMIIINHFQKYLLFPLIIWNFSMGAFLFCVIYFLKKAL